MQLLSEVIIKQMNERNPFCTALLCHRFYKYLSESIGTLQLLVLSFFDSPIIPGWGVLRLLQLGHPVLSRVPGTQLMFAEGREDPISK